MIQKYSTFSGAGSAANGAATTAIVAAPATGKAYRLTAGTLSVVVAATGGSGKVSLKDGTTVIMSWDGNAVGNIMGFNFGEIGYPVSGAINLVVESAVTNQATAFAAVVGFILG